MTSLRTLVSIAILTCGHACAETHRVEVMTVLANGNCKTITTGVQLIDYAALAQLRGTRLIGMTEAPAAAAKPLHLIAIIPGQYPTAGYSLALDESTPALTDPLILRVKLIKPPAESMLAQMITHPCLVVGLDDPAVQHVRVIDDTARVLGEVDVVKPQ